ncbi:recombinase family protein (plasmid) [Streptomyces sp. NBC_01186]|uniref:recombinase family protein n=1 Tax=unclassified Streptomyces TaxID=2593676 RepID=UPI002DD8D0CB|nr:MULTISPECIES: recombinase family protein [unclassified Streptomyces]WSB82209.1 recombinase family protein [Streptomyces sp. NBC_01775]WSS18179.1 recombinase family protein [Streptomyces sp. NBC_01186]
MLDEAAVGGTIRVADAARLLGSAKDVVQIREVVQRHGLRPHIATGAWSGFYLAADDPQTKLFVTMLAGVLEFHRDVISESTKEGASLPPRPRTRRWGARPCPARTRRPTS